MASVAVDVPDGAVGWIRQPIGETDDHRPDSLRNDRGHFLAGLMDPCKLGGVLEDGASQRDSSCESRDRRDLVGFLPWLEYPASWRLGRPDRNDDHVLDRVVRNWVAGDERTLLCARSLVAPSPERSRSGPPITRIRTCVRESV